MPCETITGRVAVVTGGSRGIGLAIAARLRQDGATVVITGRRAESLKAAGRRLSGLPGRGAVGTEVAHAADPEQARRCLDRTLERYGSLDVLVNNAATSPVLGQLADLDLAVADKLTRVNMYAPVHWAGLAYRSWMQKHGGAILNIASIGGLVAADQVGYYNATKAALIHLTRQLAAEMGPGVRVNAIAPGLVKTEMSRTLWQDRESGLAGRLPLGRLGTPEDIAAGAAFLLGDDADWITGHTLVIDGGALARPDPTGWTDPSPPPTL